MPNSFPFLLFSVALSLVAGCCAPASDSSHASAEIKAHWSGPHGGSDSPTTFVVRNAADWTALWNRLGREAPHALNPAREIGIAVFIGERRTSGYSVEWAGLRSNPDTLTIEYRERVPPTDAMLAQVITSPWVVGLLPYTDRPIEFVEVARAAPVNR